MVAEEEDDIVQAVAAVTNKGIERVMDELQEAKEVAKLDEKAIGAIEKKLGMERPPIGRWV